MKAHLIDTDLLVPRSMSSAKVKVKYQTRVSKKMGVLGALVFHKYIFADALMAPFHRECLVYMQGPKKFKILTRPPAILHSSYS